MQRVHPDISSAHSNPNPNPNPNPIPDCSAVTDSQLSKTIVSTWPMDSDGIARIPYGFSLTPLWSHPATYLNLSMQKKLRLAPIDSIKKQAVIRTALDKWVQASHGKLEFIETDYINLFSRGIFFNFAGSAADLSNLGSGAFTVQEIDNAGQLRQALIFLAEDSNQWELSTPEKTFLFDWATAARLHEIGHGLGLNHLHETPQILTALNKTICGIFCSAMLYPYKLAEIAQRQNDCDFPFGVTPGQLDRRMIDLGYNSTFSVPDFSVLKLHYAYNSADVFILSMAIYSIHEVLYVAAFKYSKNDRAALLIADTGLLALMIAFEFPVWMSVAFAMTVLSKRLHKIIPDNMGLYSIILSYTLIHGIMNPIISIPTACLTALPIPYLPSSTTKELKNEQVSSHHATLFSGRRPSMCTRISERISKLCKWNSSVEPHAVSESKQLLNQP